MENDYDVLKDNFSTLQSEHHELEDVHFVLKDDYRKLKAQLADSNQRRKTAETRAAVAEKLLSKV